MLSNLQAIAYMSRANKEILQDDLDRLLLSARQYNAQHEISGVLLYNTGLFFQYFEGSPNAVELVYERINQDPKHKVMMEVFNSPIEKRNCSEWFMGFCRAPNGLIQEVAHQSWLSKLPSLNQSTNDCIGLQMLMKFWHNMANKT